jgi:hypothetical protein
MKKLLSLAAGCCILLACNNQPAEQSTKTDSTATAAAETKPGSSKDVEFADAKYMISVAGWPIMPTMLCIYGRPVIVWRDCRLLQNTGQTGAAM